MSLKSKWIQLGIAFALGVIVLLLPRPEGTKFKITGDMDQKFLQQISQHFTLISEEKDKTEGYIVEAKRSGRRGVYGGFFGRNGQISQLAWG